MRKFLALLGIIVTSYGTAFSQIPPTAANADPAAGSISLVGGGNQINQTAHVDYTVTNEATVPPATTGNIPVGSLEVTIGFPLQYGLQVGVTPVVANWTVLAHTSGPGGLLVITNNQAIDAGNELVASVPVVGFVQIAAPQTTTMSIDRRLNPSIIVANINTNNDANTGFLAVSAPLPIKLASFAAKQTSCGVVNLDWVTTKEQNVSHFDIQYSKDGREYTEVKRVSAQNSIIGATYNTVVKQADKDGFYRLKMVDFDGVFSYSNVAKVTLTCEPNVITVSPNPATTAFNIAGLENAAEIRLFNIAGQEILKRKVEAGTSKIDVSMLPAGNYNLIISDAYGTRTTFKVVKL